MHKAYVFYNFPLVPAGDSWLKVAESSDVVLPTPRAQEKFN